jgi:hypothetical protein
VVAGGRADVGWGDGEFGWGRFVFSIAVSEIKRDLLREEGEWERKENEKEKNK